MNRWSDPTDCNEVPELTAEEEAREWFDDWFHHWLTEWHEDGYEIALAEIERRELQTTSRSPS